MILKEKNLKVTTSEEYGSIDSSKKSSTYLRKIPHKTPNTTKFHWSLVTNCGLRISAIFQGHFGKKHMPDVRPLGLKFLNSIPNPPRNDFSWPLGESGAPIYTVDGRHPAPPGICMKPCKSWDEPPINWCRISSINSMKVICRVVFFFGGGGKIAKYHHHEKPWNCWVNQVNPVNQGQINKI